MARPYIDTNIFLMKSVVSWRRCGETACSALFPIAHTGSYATTSCDAFAFPTPASEERICDSRSER